MKDMLFTTSSSPSHDSIMMSLILHIMTITVINFHDNSSVIYDVTLALVFDNDRRRENAFHRRGWAQRRFGTTVIIQESNKNRKKVKGSS